MEKEFAERVVRGEEEACEAFYRQYMAWGRTMLFRMRIVEEQEDVLHSAFARFYRSRASVREPRALLQYALRAARHEALTRIRGRKKIEEIKDVHVDPAKGPEESILEKESASAWKEMIERLATREQEIVIRCFYMNQRDWLAAKEMRLSEAAFKSAKFRTLRNLRRAVRLPLVKK